MNLISYRIAQVSTTNIFWGYMLLPKNKAHTNLYIKNVLHDSDGHWGQIMNKINEKKNMRVKMENGKNNSFCGNKR